MIVCLNDSWKIPVGYFLIDKMTASTKKQLLLQCIELCHQAGVIIQTVTFDGLSSNQMGRLLGCDFDSEANRVCHFKNPATGGDIDIFIDVCHCIKLVRNTLWEFEVLVDGD